MRSASASDLRFLRNLGGLLGSDLVGSSPDSGESSALVSGRAFADDEHRHWWGVQPAGASISFHPSSPVIGRVFDGVFNTVGPYQFAALRTVDRSGGPARSVDAPGWAAVRCTARYPIPAADSGSLIGGGVPGGSRSAGTGFRPVSTDGAGITMPGLHRLIAARSRALGRSGSGSGRRTRGWSQPARRAWGRGTPVAWPPACRGHPHTECCAIRARCWPA